jgi:copper chaperone CopZ
MNSTIERITLTAPDISCGHCEATIREALGALAGVARVDPSAATKRVAVEFDPVRVSQEQIEAALTEAGYPVRS